MLDPITFQRKFLLRKLWAKQQELVRAIRTHNQVAVKGCHGSGKTFACSGLVPYELTAYDESIVLVTAPTLRQVKTFWREITVAISSSQIHYPEPAATSWELSPKRYAQGFTSTKGVNAQGFHGRRVTILADEAIGIAPEIWDAIEGIRSAGDVRLVMLCNPTVPSGPVFDAFGKLRGTPGHATITISAFDTPNLAGLTLESLLQLSEEELDYAPFPWLIRRRWVKEMFHKWGPNNPRFLARVLGEFPSQSQWAVFSLEWIEKARREPTAKELSEAAGSYIQVGIDVAAGGDDETAACARVNGMVVGRASWQEVDPRGALVAWLNTLRRLPWRLGPVVVDTVGVGHGMALHIRDCGFEVFGFKAGGAAMDNEQFLNAKAEAYFRLRDIYKAGYISHHTAEQIDDDCEAQLCTVEYRELARGQIQVEPKEDARKRGVPSPDRAEAEVMAFCHVVPRQQTVVYGGGYQISPV